MKEWYRFRFEIFISKITPIKVKINEYFKKLMIEKTPNEDGFQEYGLKDTLLSYPDPDTKPKTIAPRG